MTAPRSRPAVHAVRLLDRWTDPVAPAALPVADRMRSGTRVVLTVLLLAATAAVFFLSRELWTGDTPGWWFNALFTVLLGGLVLALWGGFLAALVDGRTRTLARARWADGASTATALNGTIAARTVSTLEDGQVHAFDVTVVFGTGRATASWKMNTRGSNPLLQSQVPAVGAAARIWRLSGATDDDPLVVDVVDPSSPFADAAHG